MRAEIDSSGVMSVVSESETEAYALRKWLEGGEMAMTFHVSVDGFPETRHGAPAFNVKIDEGD